MFYKPEQRREKEVNKLKSIRENAGMSVSDLAKSSNVTRQTIYRLEAEKVDTANTKTLKALADALKVNVVDFFMP